MNKLAIVIPAFKKDYLDETMQSLASQTTNDFSVYIGNDNSPEEIYKIIEPYTKILNLKYVEFDTNLGSISLVKQWNRCIDLSEDEPWICLLGDDDLMESNCVEYFLKEISTNNFFELYRFNLKVINENGNLIYSAPEYPEVENGWEFIINRLKWKRTSAICPYIFSRKAYLYNNGFEEFDLAWCSDDATWLKFVGSGTIKTIKGPKVSWRQSGFNISAREDLLDRKLNALIHFTNWLINRNDENYISNKDLKIFIKEWLFKHLASNNDIETFKILQKKIEKNNSPLRISDLDYFINKIKS